MLIKPLYDAYLRNNPEPDNFLTPLGFLRLPYQHRLFLAGAKLILVAPERLGLPELRGIQVSVPDIPLGCFEPDYDCPLSYNDVHFWVKGEWWMLFPFEYQIILPNL